jgi:hypothetical protein
VGRIVPFPPHLRAAVWLRLGYERATLRRFLLGLGATIEEYAPFDIEPGSTASRIASPSTTRGLRAVPRRSAKAAQSRRIRRPPDRSLGLRKNFRE